MSVLSCIIPVIRKKEGQFMNLDEYKAYILETRKQATMSAVSAIISATKKEGSK